MAWFSHPLTINSDNDLIKFVQLSLMLVEFDLTPAGAFGAKEPFWVASLTGRCLAYARRPKAACKALNIEQYLAEFQNKANTNGRGNPAIHKPVALFCGK